MPSLNLDSKATIRTSLCALKAPFRSTDVNTESAFKAELEIRIQRFLD